MSDGHSDYLRIQRQCCDAAHLGMHTKNCPKFGDAAKRCNCQCGGSHPGNADGSCPDVVSADLFPGDRKGYPVLTGALMYFPFAFAELAKCSAKANEQHNPGEPIHWDYAKSIGDGNELLRHLMDSLGPNPVDAEGTHHDVKVLWRAAETVERRIRAERGLPGPPKRVVAGPTVTAGKGSACRTCDGTGTYEPVLAGKPGRLACPDCNTNP